MKVLERLAWVALGVFLYWFVVYFGPRSSVDDQVEAMQGRRFIAVGYDPDAKYIWKRQNGGRWTSDGDNTWTAITFRKKESAETAIKAWEKEYVDGHPLK